MIAVFILGDVLGIVLDHNAVLIAAAVKFDNLTAQVIVQRDTRKRENCLIRLRAGVGAGQKQNLRFAVARVPVTRHGEHAAVGQNLEAVDAVAVHVAFQPVHQLVRCVGLSNVAVDFTVIIIIEVIRAIAGVELIRVLRDLDRLAKVLFYRVDKLQFAPAVRIDHNADLVCTVLRKIAAVVTGVKDVQQIAVLVKQANIAPAANVDIAVGVNQHTVHIEAILIVQLGNSAGVKINCLCLCAGLVQLNQTVD